MALPTMRPGITGREFVRVAGGFGAPAQGTSPAGGLDIDNAGNLATDGDITAQSITVENDVQQWNVEARGDNNDKFIIRDVTNAQDVVEILPNAGNVRMEVAATETVFNQAGLDVDHRIEGAADANLLFCDGGNDLVGFGTNAPGHPVHMLFDSGDNTPILVLNTTSGVDAALGFVSQIPPNWIMGPDRSDGRNFKIAPNLADVAIDTVITFEEGGNVGIGANPAAEVILDLASTTAAFRPPSMTTTQRDLLTALAGMMIYNTTTNTVQFYNGTAWATI